MYNKHCAGRDSLALVYIADSGPPPLASSSPEILFCKLLLQLLSTRRAQLTTAAADFVISTLCKWAGGTRLSSNDSSRSSSRAVGNNYGSGMEDFQRQLQTEALQALGAMMPDHITQVCSSFMKVGASVIFWSFILDASVNGLLRTPKPQN